MISLADFLEGETTQTYAILAISRVNRVLWHDEPLSKNTAASGKLGPNGQSAGDATGYACRRQPAWNIHTTAKPRLPNGTKLMPVRTATTLQ